MNELQKKIYDYFDCDSELKVLFIFQNISVTLKWGELNINQKNFLILRCCFSHLKKSSTNHLFL